MHVENLFTLTFLLEVNRHYFQLQKENGLSNEEMDELSERNGKSEPRENDALNGVENDEQDKMDIQKEEFHNGQKEFDESGEIPVDRDEDSAEPREEVAIRNGLAMEGIGYDINTHENGDIFENDTENNSEAIDPDLDHGHKKDEEEENIPSENLKVVEESINDNDEDDDAQVQYGVI